MDTIYLAYISAILIFSTYFLSRRKLINIFVALTCHILLILYYNIGISHFRWGSSSLPYTELDTLYSNLLIYTCLILSIFNSYLMFTSRIIWDKGRKKSTLVIEIYFLAILTVLTFLIPVLLIYWLILFQYSIIFGIIALIIHLIFYYKAKRKK